MVSTKIRAVLRAAFPLGEQRLVLLASKPFHADMEDHRRYRSQKGLRVRAAAIDKARPTRLILELAGARPAGVTVDRIEIRGLSLVGGARLPRVTSPPFVHGIVAPSDLKVPYLADSFPYASTLVGVHVSVACCTGCNGGIHDRNLVVLNHHLGGPWTGIWVQTAKTIDTPYPRWLKVLCAGGVIAEKGGSTTVVDEGWMEIQKLPEEPHHAPPPLAIRTEDVPSGRSTALLPKGLDGSWVQFDDLLVKGVRHVDATPGSRAVSLPRTELTFSDRSDGLSTAYLYQPSARALTEGQRIRCLRGFVHAERPGVYVLLSDKVEDIEV